MSDKGQSQRIVVTGVIGEDVHITGIRILEHALRSKGLQVMSLGIHNSQADFVAAAREARADAIFVSSLCGHAEMLVDGLRDKCIEAGLKNVLLYLGGQLVMHKVPWCEVERKFKDMGFDRVFAPFVLPEPVLGQLQADLLERGA